MKLFLKKHSYLYSIQMSIGPDVEILRENMISEYKILLQKVFQLVVKVCSQWKLISPLFTFENRLSFVLSASQICKHQKHLFTLPSLYLCNFWFFHCISRKVRTKYKIWNFFGLILLLSQFKKRRSMAFFELKQQQKLVFSHRH